MVITRELLHLSLLSDPGDTSMAERTVTRADLCQIVYKWVALSHKKVAALVELVLKEEIKALYA